ncbi:MAG: DNA polymerase III subunit delta' [Negativicutes bacterium]|nr:DNA polymerase III subunit delta' [Negativicutes bacterium]
MHWEDIAGHTGAVKMLKNMVVAARVPHALLFTGPAGLGKALVAKVLAEALLCSGPEKPCGGCPSCRAVAQGSHADLTVLPGDGTSLKIDQIRELQHQAGLAPYQGERRVFIIEDADRLTTPAAGSLLKILEEPPPGTVFILTAVSPHVLLTTIVSRCLVLPFHPLPAEALIRLLGTRGASPEQAAIAARLSGGRVGTALALLGPDGFAARDQAVQIVAALPGARADLVWDLAAGAEAGQLQILLRNLTYIFRDLSVILIGQDKLLLNLDITAKLRAMAAAWEEAGLTQALNDIKHAVRALEGNANPRLTCEALLIRLMDAAGEGKDNANGCWHTV